MQVFHKQFPKSLKYLFCYQTYKTTGDDLEHLQKSNFINRNATTKFLCYNISSVGKIYTAADWNSMGRVITQTHGRGFQTLGRAFSFFLKSQKLGRVF